MMRFFFIVGLLFIRVLLFAQAETDFIHIDQFGYRLNDQKIAVISNPQNGYNAGESFSPGATYEVHTTAGVAVFTGTITVWNSGATDVSSGDKAWHFDFSSVTQAGEYYILDVVNNVKSYHFSIADDVYQNVLKQSLRAFYYQRCGTAKAAPFAEVSWTDGSCHLGNNQDLTCRSIEDPNNAALEKDLSGGWHDAGDYNKYVNFLLAPSHDLLAAYEETPNNWGDDLNIPESGNGTADILDEIKWALDWLLKMQLTDGSVLMKVSVTTYQAASPPSSDNAPHYYGPPQSSATRTACSIFAHAAIVFKEAGMTTYANLLESKAVLAWTWLQNNSGFSNYNNTGFLSANSEVSTYDQEATTFAAAVYLFVLTDNNTYKTYVDNHYTDIHAIDWSFWYPFETVYQDALLYYATSANGSSSVQTIILDNFKISLKTNNTELLPAHQMGDSPYSAYLSENNYVWSSNRVKANSSLLFYNMITYDVDPVLNNTYTEAAQDYVHYLHGVNPQNLVYLSNMNSHGATKSCSEIYHAWFADGTNLDVNPAPGFLTGGPNKNFDPAATYTIAPPENQPTEKSYKDWNTSYPENSWEITEPANSYQASYIKMLSKFIIPSTPLPVEVIHAFSATPIHHNQVLLKWSTGLETNNMGFEIQRSDGKFNFQKIGFVSANIDNFNQKIYQLIDEHPLPTNYYRYKQIDLDGRYTYSAIIAINISQTSFSIYPNIVSTGDQATLVLDLDRETYGHIDIITSTGQKIDSQPLGLLTKGKHKQQINCQLAKGNYNITLRLGGSVLVRSLVVK